MIKNSFCWATIIFTKSKYILRSLSPLPLIDKSKINRRSLENSDFRGLRFLFSFFSISFSFSLSLEGPLMRSLSSDFSFSHVNYNVLLNFELSCLCHIFLFLFYLLLKILVMVSGATIESETLVAADPDMMIIGLRYYRHTAIDRESDHRESEPWSHITSDCVVL